jgi:lipid II:glycine glycyltransferase (peptidoglycan interpeptide bridge formation enzyme)
MTPIFDAVLSPDSELLAQISSLSPQSPFDTPAYGAALAARNADACALLLKNGNQPVNGCLAALAGSRWNRRLEIFTTPALDEPDIFWDGVAAFCRDHKVCDLDLQTFASVAPSMPTFDHQLSERERSEYVADLGADGLFESCSNNHKRSIRKARKAGLEVARSDSLDDYQTHIKLMRASMTRRSTRGEKVPMPSADDFDFALLRQGAGELFQARSSASVLASMLVLKSSEGGYYQSAGTIPEGMKLGASPFLISEVANLLAAEGYRTFNLGGVDPGADGLRRFKAGFGTREVRLTAARYSMISPLNRTARGVARGLKAVPGYLVNLVRR